MKTARSVAVAMSGAPRQSVLVLLSSLEIPVRPFGPDREPKARPGGGVALDNGQTGQIG
jgi:hypothetical protein